MHRRQFTRALLAGAATAVAGSVARAQSAALAPVTIALVPFGGFATEALQDIAAGLRAGFGVEVVTSLAVGLPNPTWTVPHDRYDTEDLFEIARRFLISPATRFLAVLDEDVAPTAPAHCNWGLGDVDPRGGVISLARCRLHAPTVPQVHFRLVTGSLHVIGHSLGLAHCANPSCLMTAAHGVTRTIDRTSGQLCSVCRTSPGLPPRRP